MRSDAITRAIVTGVSRAPLIVCLAALLAVGAAKSAHATDPGTLQIGFFCGPPPASATPAEFRRIEAAGFTFALAPCNVWPSVAENRAALAAAAGTGVRVFVRDARIPLTLGEPDAAARLDAVIADYADAPAFGGYDLADEPAEGAFHGLGEVVAYLRTHDPAHPAFVNALPNYFTDAAGYARYLDRYATEADTAMFSFDFYPFTIYGDRPGYLPNLDSLRNLSLRHSRPFWVIGQATPHLAYRQPTEAEKRWQAFQALAYGATGISYFTYWSVANEGFGPGIIGPDARPTGQYREVRRINARLQAIGGFLATARSIDVFQSPPALGAVSPRRPGAVVDIRSDVPLTIGVFETDEHVYALLTNGRADAAVTTDVDLSFGATLPQELDAATGTWSTVRATVVGTASRTRVTLAPGDGTLFRATTPVPPGSLGPEALAYQAGTAAARGCPAHHVMVGQSLRADGFWLCARSDLAERGFYVGRDGRYYRVENSSTVAQRRARRGECRGTSRRIGTFGDLWVCMDDAPRRSQALPPPSRGDGCPAGFRLDGVGLCARSDLVARSFYVPREPAGPIRRPPS